MKTSGGRGFAAQILRQELGMLTALSSHPETRLTLWAGGARDPQRGGALQSVGVYVWAKAGFEAAPAPSTLASGGDKPRCEDDPGRAELSDVALMRRQLGRWLDAQVEAGTLTPEAAAEVKTRAATLAQPHDFAALTGGAEAFPIQVGEGPKAGALGKAFLLSAHAPRWEGALKVNQAGPAMARAEAWVTAALARGGAVEAQQAEAWQAALRSGDDAKLTEALLHIGRAGGAALIEPLLALKAARPDLEAAVKDALLKVRGRWTPPRPKVTYAAPGGRNQAFTLPPQFAELAKLAPAKLLVIAVSDPDHRRAQAALQQLADKHLDKAAPVVEEAASKLYARFAGDEDRWLLRQAAVQILGKLPQEAGIPALVEASRVEDDINVMISIQRVLDNAEHPAAVEPAEQLGQRIEAMKAEIEKALAEL